MANNIKGITIEIGANTTKLSKELSDVNKEIKGTQAELREVERLLKLDPKNTEALAQKQKLLKQAISETKEKLDVLKTAEAQVEEQFKKGEVSEEQYRALKREIEATEISLKNLEEQAKESNKTLESIGDTFGKFGDKATTIGKKLMPVTAGITAMGSVGVAAAMDLDEGYDTIITKTGATGEALEELNRIAEEIFTELPIEMDDAGTAVGEINTRFGATGETLKNLSIEFIKFADINGTDLNNSIGKVDKIMEQFNIDASETGNVLGLITKKGQDTGISVDTLMDSLQKNGATFKEMGLNMVQSTNLLAQFETNGVNADTAIAGLRKSIKAYTDEGKSINEALELTIDSIKNASSETEALSIAQEIFGTKGAAEMATAIREGRIDLKNLSSEMKEYGTTVEDTFNATQDPWDEAKVAANNLKLAAAELGQTLLSSLQPIITSTTNKTKVFTQWFKNLNDSQKQMIIKIAAVIAAIAPALIIFGKVATAISKIVAVVGKIGPAVKAAKAAFAAFNAVLAANPIILVVAAIVAAIAIMVTLYNKCEWFRNGVNAIWNAIKTVFFDAWNAIIQFFSVTLPNAFLFVCGKYEEFQNYISNLINNTLQLFENLWLNIQNIYKGIGKWFKERFTEAYKLATDAWAAAGNYFSNKYQSIKNAFSTVKEFFRNTFLNAWIAVQNVFSNWTSFFAGLWGRIRNTFTNLGSSIANAIGSSVKNGINGVIYMIENTINRAISIINGAIRLINKIPGVSVSKINSLNLPKLAKGGILTQGKAIVAEAGPEIIEMVGGKTIVTPLTDNAKNTSLEKLAQRTQKTDISLTIENFYNNRKQDVKELAEEILQYAEEIKEEEERVYA